MNTPAGPDRLKTRIVLGSGTGPMHGIIFWHVGQARAAGHKAAGRAACRPWLPMTTGWKPDRNLDRLEVARAGSRQATCRSCASPAPPAHAIACQAMRSDQGR